MTFGEAWVAMEQGKKVVRPEWKESVYYLRDKKIIEYDTSKQKEYEHEGIEIFGDEVFENDWEMAKEPKDYKIFVDKEKNVYIGGVKLPFNDINVKVVFDRDVSIGRMEIQMPVKYSDYAVEL